MLHEVESTREISENGKLLRDHAKQGSEYLFCKDFFPALQEWAKELGFTKSEELNAYTLILQVGKIGGAPSEAKVLALYDKIRTELGSSKTYGCHQGACLGGLMRFYYQRLNRRRD